MLRASLLSACQFNPIRLAFDGIQVILTLPILLLTELEIVTSVTYYRLINSAAAKLIVFIVFIAGLLSSVMTVTLGWQEFKLNYLADLLPFV